MPCRCSISDDEFEFDFEFEDMELLVIRRSTTWGTSTELRYPIDLPSRERLCELFAYNNVTGELLWREREGQTQFNSAYAGKPAGRKNSSGRLQTNVDGKVRLVHRIIFKLVLDCEPTRIRHVNGDGADNHSYNLVAAPPLKLRRVERKSKNKSGITSVFWSPVRHVWFGMIQSNNRRHYVGPWKTLDDPDAIRAQMNAARALLPDYRTQRYNQRQKSNLQ
jgi:hypothetical protein